MKNLIKLLLFSCLLFSCKSEPTPINYGKDECAFCTMTIIDEKFGAEISNDKGKFFKFDSGECMMNYLKKEKQTKFTRFLVVNFNNPKELLDATTCFFVHGGDVESPMGGQLIAVKSKVEAEKIKSEKNAETLNWQELQSTEF